MVTLLGAAAVDLPWALLMLYLDNRFRQLQSEPEAQLSVLARTEPLGERLQLAFSFPQLVAVVAFKLPLGQPLSQEVRVGLGSVLCEGPLLRLVDPEAVKQARLLETFMQLAAAEQAQYLAMADEAGICRGHHIQSIPQGAAGSG